MTAVNLDPIEQVKHIQCLLAKRSADEWTRLQTRALGEKLLAQSDVANRWSLQHCSDYQQVRIGSKNNQNINIYLNLNFVVVCNNNCSNPSEDPVILSWDTILNSSVCVGISGSSGKEHYLRVDKKHSAYNSLQAYLPTIHYLLSVTNDVFEDYVHGL